MNAALYHTDILQLVGKNRGFSKDCSIMLSSNVRLYY